MTLFDGELPVGDTRIAVSVAEFCAFGLQWHRKAATGGTVSAIALYFGTAPADLLVNARDPAQNPLWKLDASYAFSALPTGAVAASAPLRFDALGLTGVLVVITVTGSPVPFALYGHGDR